jgi:hypothetical protein
LGRREEALTAITRAVDTYQVLAEQQPDMFEEDLEKALQLRELLRERPDQPRFFSGFGC